MFEYSGYQLRRKVLTFAGAKVHVTDEQGVLAAFVHVKAFKLKEDIRVYRDEQRADELMQIKARKIIDFSSAYDVVESASGRKLGALRRRGLKSIMRDEWQILDAQDNEVGKIVEDSTALALIRRAVDFAAMILPQKYRGTIGDDHVMTFKQNFNPFVMKIGLDFAPEAKGRIEPGLAIAAGILLCVIEGKQN
ncbi:MAG: hypothetical protein ABFD92_12795 [Planctomycetaceae bacterium]|nr:hypothetical protein [Planctomycetaceae bacterium]